MPDLRSFTVRRFIESSYEFFGVEQTVAVGSFYGHDPSEAMTVDAARALIEAFLGHPVPPTPPSPPSPPNPPPSGAWQPPVATVADLPTTGNGNGDVRLVLADFSLRAWNGTAHVWATVSGVTGGSGSGGTTVGVRNLFVQQAQPDVTALLVDSLWIATNPDGTPKDPSFWEVYTGNGTGDGGNLFVQQAPPAPLVDALWVPLNPDGSMQYLDQWVVFTGRGSVSGVGNSNLLIGQNLPAAPPAGSLYIPLNLNETPKTYDQWEVYT